MKLCFEKLLKFEISIIIRILFKKFQNNKTIFKNFLKFIKVCKNL